jgi:pyruvate dehydrogenase E2 component (dihydrolipoamide acetyltransferase)
MPRLSDSMEEGTILEWLKEVGEEISVGDEIAIVETDKASVPLEAAEGGVLVELVVPAGATAPLGAVIARVGGADDELAEMPAVSFGTSTSASVGVAMLEAPAMTVRAFREGGARAKATPVARRIARALGIDLATLVGTGPNGRIVKSDVEGIQAAETAAGDDAQASASHAEPAAVVAGVPAREGVDSAKGEQSERLPTRLQQIVARRMAESKATVPDFVIQTEVDMEACARLRAQLKELDPGDAPSYNDMVVKACALALRRFPMANGSWQDGRFILHGRVNVGVAVAADSALVVPTVTDADTRSLGDIGRTMRTLAASVRDGTITPPQLSGGTFTVSNLGMYGVTRFTAVVNPPQAAILAVGAVRQVPAVVDGELAVRWRTELSLTCDHRILYGAEAAQFLAAVRELLEQPLRLAF